MNRRRLVSLSGLVAVGAAAWLAHGGAASSAAEGKRKSPGAPPPLVVDKDAPLLLEAPATPEATTTKTAARIVADNSPCFVCHLNYKGEPLARRHAGANVGCVKCHGESSAHRNDEDNVTPPEIMYPLDRIDRACRKCHTTHDVPAVAVIARWRERCATKTDPKQIVCTDCHGRHRLKVRTVRWDKKTGKLSGRK